MNFLQGESPSVYSIVFDLTDPGKGVRDNLLPDFLGSLSVASWMLSLKLLISPTDTDLASVLGGAGIASTSPTNGLTISFLGVSTLKCGDCLPDGLPRASKEILESSVPKSSDLLGDDSFTEHGSVFSVGFW